MLTGYDNPVLDDESDMQTEGLGNIYVLPPYESQYNTNSHTSNFVHVYVVHIGSSVFMWFSPVL